MKLTPQQLRETADAIEAHNAGKPVQVQLKSGKWIDCLSGPEEWTFFGDLGYRPKPESKTRRWSKPDDVPGPVCWLRNNSGHEAMVIALHRDGPVCIGTEAERFEKTLPYRWENLTEWEHSTDRKTWHKCEVTE